MAEALWSNPKARWREFTSISTLSIKSLGWGTLGKGFLGPWDPPPSQSTLSADSATLRFYPRCLSHCAEVTQQTIIEPGLKALFQIHQNLGITLSTYSPDTLWLGHGKPILCSRGRQTFSVKNQIVNIQVVKVTQSLLQLLNPAGIRKAATDHM